jgi:uncharacterized membrane protein YsdA (DUF1294 family)
MNPYFKYILWTLLGTGLLVVLFTGGLKVNLFPAYIIAINIMTYLIFWYDKSIAGSECGMRVPELILHTLSFAGGPLASLLARKTLRHKTQKLKFQLIPLLAIIHHVVAYLYHFGF